VTSGAWATAGETPPAPSTRGSATLVDRGGPTFRVTKPAVSGRFEEVGGTGLEPVTPACRARALRGAGALASQCLSQIWRRCGAFEACADSFDLRSIRRDLGTGGVQVPIRDEPFSSKGAAHRTRRRGRSPPVRWLSLLRPAARPAPRPTQPSAPTRRRTELRTP
jgi:hypothetical protein